MTADTRRLFVSGLLVLAFVVLALAFEGARAAGPPPYPTVLPPPVMWTVTPPAHVVYAPSIERGN